METVDKGPFVEPSPDRLVDLMRRIPFEGDEWKQDLETLVVPLTLDQYWDAYWANEAPYYTERTIDEEEDILLRSTLWMDPLDGHDWEHGIQVI